MEQKWNKNETKLNKKGTKMKPTGKRVGFSGRTVTIIIIIIMIIITRSMSFFPHWHVSAFTDTIIGPLLRLKPVLEGILLAIIQCSERVDLHSDCHSPYIAKDILSVHF
jgi:hypothetical protein